MNSILRQALIWTMLAFAGVVSSHAQSAFWVPGSGTLQEGKANQLQLHFEGCRPDGEINIPTPGDVTLRKAGTTSSTSIINGSITRTLIINVQAIPSSKGRISIPSFKIDTDEGEIEVDGVSFEVIEATIGNSGVKPKEIYLAQLESKDSSIYQGEIFDLRYIIGFKQQYQISNLSGPEWEPESLVISGMENYDQRAFSTNNDRYDGLVFDFQGMATESGIINLPKVRQSASVVTGRRRGTFFSDPIVDSILVESNDLQLPIKPLPGNAPESFNGAVGKFEIESTVVPESVQIGEPITWTLRMNGTGNWPQGIGLPSRQVSMDFRAIQPEVKTEMEEGSRFTGSQTEDIVLIPTKAGEFKFGPVKFSYFDPENEKYLEIEIPAKTVAIAPVTTTNNSLSLPNQDASAGSGGQSSSTDILAPTIDPRGVNTLTKPIKLPTGLIDGSIGIAPHLQGKLSIWYLLWAAGPALALWILIAFVRSFFLDPNKQRRQAYARLKSLSLDDGNLKEALLNWRRAACEFWEIASKEPSAKEIQHTVEAKTSAAQADQWKALWEQSDKLLFGKSPTEIDNWKTKMQSTLSSTPKPSRSLAGFLSSPAWKWATIFAIAISAASVPSYGDDIANEEYQSGDFVNAVKSWEDILNTNPDNWIARHNLGLAHAQQKNWGNAFASLVSAYALNPKDPSINWNLKLVLNQTGSYDNTIATMLQNEGMTRVVTQLSPAEWERVAYFSTAALAVSLCLWVALLFFKWAGVIRRLVLSVGILSIGIAVVADWAYGQYGFLADPNAAVVASPGQLKSVPSDIDGEQLEDTLSEGAIARVKKDFLGWTQIELPNGESGWIRQQHLKPIYGLK